MITMPLINVRPHAFVQGPNLREFVNYRHPDPWREEPRVCSTQLVAFLEDSGRSAAEFREARLESTPLAVLTHLAGKGVPILTLTLSLRPDLQ